MVFMVEIHNDTVVHSLIRRFLVVADDGVEAGKKALKVAREENSEEKNLYARNINLIEGELIQ